MALESHAREARKFAQGVYPQSALQRAPNDPGLEQPVRYRRSGRANTAEKGDVAEDPGTQRWTVPGVVVSQELVLELCQVHVGRALGLAGFAFQAQIKSFKHTRVGVIGLRQASPKSGAKGGWSATGRGCPPATPPRATD